MASITKITFTLPDGSQQKYLLSRDGTYLIGSAAENDITLADPEITAKHAKLVADETNDSRWFIQDLGDSSIKVLDDGSTEQIGRTSFTVSVTDEAIAEAARDPEPEYDEPAPEPADEGHPDNRKQLEALRKAQEMRDVKNAAIMITVCGILSFIAGLVWRLMQ